MRTNNVKKIVLAGMVALTPVAFTGCGGAGSGLNPQIAGVTGPNVEFVNGRVMLSMVLQNITIDGGATIPIPKYPNSSLQVGPDFQSTGTLVMLTINAADFLGSGATGLDPQALPGGRPLPSVAAGALPAIALKVPQLSNMVFYVGPEVMGFFVPFNKLDLAGSILTFRFHNTEGEAVGILALVGSDQHGANAGILAMMRADLMGILPKPSSSTLKQLAKLY